jgi:hypothetical protein
MGDLSNFERGQIVGACIAGASVMKTAILLGVLRATVSQVMSAYTNHGKTVLRCVNDDVTTIKPEHQTSGNARVILVESSFMLFPTSERVYVWRTPKEAYNAECPVLFQQ